MSRVICLVGFSETSREWANEQPADVEIWGQNESHLFLTRWDRWFQMHPKKWNDHRRVNNNLDFINRVIDLPDFEDQLRKFMGAFIITQETFGRPKLHLDWLAKCGVPVYMQEVDERVPTAVRYPQEEVFAEFGRYFTSSTVYMMGLALLEHKQGKEIGEFRLAGLDMAYGTEWSHQRPCFEYYLGLARGMGITVTLPPLPYSTPLLNAPLYAIDEAVSVPETLVPIAPKSALDADPTPPGGYRALGSSSLRKWG